MKKVVTFGEILLRLGAPEYLRLNQCNNLEVSFAGAEANVAVSLANYGIPVEFVTALPDNPITQKCISELRGLKVNTNHVLYCGNRIGILFLETGSMYRSSRVFYDRENSSITCIDESSFNWDEIFKDACWFHWTGITPALSERTANVLRVAIHEAKKRNITISCDINFRNKLWKYGKNASEVMPELVKYADVILGNEEDCEQVFGIKPQGFDVNQNNSNINPESFKYVCERMLTIFPNCKKMIITLRGSINANHNTWAGVLYDGNQLYNSVTYNLTHIVDRVGGGDSFMGALIYGLIKYPNNNQYALDFAVAASCLKHTIKGDYNQVSVEEVDSLVNGNINGRVKR